LIEDANAKNDQNMQDVVTGEEVFPRGKLIIIINNNNINY